jgi:hypothetical protein
MTRLLALLLLLCVPLASLADDRAKLIGNWKLTSWVIELQETGERRPALGGKTSGVDRDRAGALLQARR